MLKTYRYYGKDTKYHYIILLDIKKNRFQIAHYQSKVWTGNECVCFDSGLL